MPIIIAGSPFTDVKYPKLKYKGRAEATLLRNKDSSVSILSVSLILHHYTKITLPKFIVRGVEIEQ